MIYKASSVMRGCLIKLLSHCRSSLEQYMIFRVFSLRTSSDPSSLYLSHSLPNNSTICRVSFGTAADGCDDARGE